MWKKEFEDCVKEETTSKFLMLDICLEVRSDQEGYKEQKTQDIHTGFCIAFHQRMMQDVRDGKCKTVQEIIDELKEDIVNGKS